MLCHKCETDLCYDFRYDHAFRCYLLVCQKCYHYHNINHFNLDDANRKMLYSKLESYSKLDCLSRTWMQPTTVPKIIPVKHTFFEIDWLWRLNKFIKHTIYVHCIKNCDNLHCIKNCDPMDETNFEQRHDHNSKMCDLYCTYEEFYSDLLATSDLSIMIDTFTRFMKDIKLAKRVAPSFWISCGFVWYELCFPPYETINHQSPFHLIESEVNK